jgi:hypothetical protein
LLWLHELHFQMRWWALQWQRCLHLERLKA